jgi:hypothetical protein
MQNMGREKKAKGRYRSRNAMLRVGENISFLGGWVSFSDQNIEHCVTKVYCRVNNYHHWCQQEEAF